MIVDKTVENTKYGRARPAKRQSLGEHKTGLKTKQSHKSVTVMCLKRRRLKKEIL